LLDTITDFLLKETAGSTFPNLPGDKLKHFKVPLPPISEQQRITAILNEQMAATEKARVAAEAQLAAARALPAAYLREVFESEGAKEWPRVRLGDVLTLRKEVIHPYDNPIGPAVFVGLEHIESGTGTRTGAVELEMSQLTGRKPKFYKGDIVYGYLRPYLNKVWVAEFDGLCSVDQYVYSVAPERAEVHFIAWFMRSAAYLKRAPITTTPGQLPRIRTEEVASVEIDLAPLATQRHILNQLTTHLEQANRISKAAESGLTAIEKLPGALLRRAFAGEL
jgi:type I restriction enzyme S subunit